MKGWKKDRRLVGTSTMALINTIVLVLNQNDYTAFAYAP